jgi:hypothetical protein
VGGACCGLNLIRDIQVLCPMNRGGLGARSLNIDLQQALNPPGELRVERFGSTYGIGDKVMQVENDYDKEVYNGDLGVIRARCCARSSLLECRHSLFIIVCAEREYVPLRRRRRLARRSVGRDAQARSVRAVSSSPAVERECRAQPGLARLARSRHAHGLCGRS